MQLKRASLSAATLSLLGAAVAPAPASAQVEAPVPEKRWQFDTATLVYVESDSRVTAIEPVVSMAYDFGDERTLGAKLVLDSLTGASPNGAMPASTPQTFARPSGNGSYTIAPGELPLDDTFKDTRVALSADYETPAGDAGRLGFGLNGSTEYDYLSAGASARYAHDFNQNNTTLSAGVSFESDESNPVGGVPVPLTVPENKDGASDSKTVLDVIVGLTQVLDPRTLVQVNYSLSTSSGYHTDPYKILSVVDTSGEPLRYVYESRPDSRSKHALFARYKRLMLARDVLDLSVRFLTDDWGVQSHTLDTLYRWNFTDKKFLEPHLRWYVQSAADFYRMALDDGEETTLDHASADPRLGAFSGITAGLKYGHTLASGNQWTARFEYYQQAGDIEGLPQQGAAGLSQFDLKPELTAVMFTVGYRFKW